MPTERIQLAFVRAFRAAGRPCDMAVFTDTSPDAPEVKLYFSPAVATLAMQFAATPCEQPSTQSLGVFAGDQRAWDFYFDDPCERTDIEYADCVTRASSA
jgi:hypothetical protein